VNWLAKRRERLRAVEAELERARQVRRELADMVLCLQASSEQLEDLLEELIRDEVDSE
jgi:hypothetical protein